MSKLSNEEWRALTFIYFVSSGTQCADGMRWKPGDMIGGSSGVTLFSTFEGAEYHVLTELTYEGQEYPWKFLYEYPELSSTAWYTEITGGGHWYRWVLITKEKVFP